MSFSSPPLHVLLPLSFLSPTMPPCRTSTCAWTTGREVPFPARVKFPFLFSRSLPFPLFSFLSHECHRIAKAVEILLDQFWSIPSHFIPLPLPIRIAPGPTIDFTPLRPLLGPTAPCPRISITAMPLSSWPCTFEASLFIPRMPT